MHTFLIYLNFSLADLVYDGSVELVRDAIESRKWKRHDINEALLASARAGWFDSMV